MREENKNKAEEIQMVCDLLQQKREELNTMSDDLQDLKEMLDKKELIIQSQEDDLKQRNDELRSVRVELREKTEALVKTTDIVLLKEEMIAKLTRKISQLNTRQLVALNDKVVKTKSQKTQTEESTNKLVSYFTQKPLFKPNFDKIQSTIHDIGNKKEGSESGTVKDEKEKGGCEKCKVLEAKLRKKSQECRNQIVEIKKYQEQLQGKVEKSSADKATETVEHIMKPPDSDEDVAKDTSEEYIDVDVTYGTDDSVSCEEEKEKEKEKEKEEGQTEHKEDRIRNKTAGEGMQQNLEQTKDQTKLCNRYVEGRNCRYSNDCRYTHKKICQQLLDEGVCTNKVCEEGHNIDGLCHNFQAGKCQYTPCRFVHIKMN